MNPDTGEIKLEDHLTPAEKRTWQRLSPEEHAEVKDMNRRQRREWARKNRKPMPRKERPKKRMVRDASSPGCEIQRVSGNRTADQGLWGRVLVSDFGRIREAYRRGVSHRLRGRTVFGSDGPDQVPRRSKPARRDTAPSCR